MNLTPLDILLLISPFYLGAGLYAAYLKWREDHPRHRHHGHAAE